MTATAETIDLNAIAGVTLSAPLLSYEIDGLSFGRARLVRDVASGRWNHLELHLDESAIERCRKAGAATAAKIDVFLNVHSLHFARGAGVEGIRELIVEHHLFSLRDLFSKHRGPELPLVLSSESPAGTQIRKMVSFFQSCQEKLVAGIGDQCKPCAELHERTQAPALVRSRGPWSVFSNAYYGQMVVTPCPHGPMVREAMSALFERWPELTFELIKLVVAATHLATRRFVLEPELAHALIRLLLTGQAHQADDYFYGLGMVGAARTFRHLTRPRLKRIEGDAMSVETRGALSLSATAWGVTATPHALVAAPSESDAPTPSLRARRAPSERLELAISMPASLQALTPDPPPAPSAPATRRKKTTGAAAPVKALPGPAIARAPKADGAPPVRSSPTQDTTAAPSALVLGQELMTAQLRERGLSDVKIKKLLADGALERAGFGWYRIVRLPL